jgi:glycosyltransferase involved in cell wall biosynthesis
MNELVSIVTPLSNSEEFIEETIISVLSQTYKNCMN